MLRVREEPVGGRTPPADPARRRAWLALAVVGVGFAVTAVWGVLLEARGDDLHLGFVPFYGAIRWTATWSIVVPVALAAVIVTQGPRFAVRLRWSGLLVTSWIVTAVWSVALAASAGWHAVSEPLVSPFDYRAVLPAARRSGLGSFLRTYIDQLGHYSVHVQGHPPGMVTLLWVLDAIGLRGPGWEAAVIIGVGATAPIAVLVTVRILAGEDTARLFAPFLVLGPWTLFVATIGDAIFTAMAAATIALLALAASGRKPASAVWAAGAGAVGALTLHFTYGLVPLLVLLGGTVLVVRRRLALVVPAVIGASMVTAVWIAAGFWWWAGFNATRHWHDVGASPDRPYVYFFVADLVVLAVMLGPAVVAALTLRLDRHLAVLVVPALLAVLVADLSGLSKGEVERIWLPFMPWISVAVVGLVRRWPQQVSRWLAAQAALALVLQATIAWPW
jgi:hypothetical protein